MNLNVSPQQLNIAGPQDTGLESLFRGESLSAGQSSQEPATPFAETFNQMLADLSKAQEMVGAQSLELAKGNTDNIQEIAINAAKADLAFQFVLEIRNRLIATYQEVMRMQI